jgi:hypothetical protein
MLPSALPDLAAGGPALAPRPLPAPVSELHPALTSFEAAEELLGEDPRWGRLSADQRWAGPGQPDGMPASGLLVLG